MEENMNNLEEKALWKSFRAGRENEGTIIKIDPNDLAQWLDGRADARVTAHVEARMVAHPPFLAEVTELRALMAGQPAEASTEVITKATAVFDDFAHVTPPAAATERVVSIEQIGSLRRFLVPVRWAAAAAAIIAACVGGYYLGHDTRQEKSAASAELVVAMPDPEEVSLGVELVVNEPTMVFPSGIMNGMEVRHEN